MALTDPRQAAIRLEWVRTTSWLALFAVALHLLHGVYLRLDWTRDGRYALSDAARAVAARVEAPLVARVYVTERLDPPYHGHRAALLDLLAELDAAAGGRIEVVTRDPSVDPAARDEAQRNGVRGLPYAFRSADRTETRTVWLGVALQYRERSVAIDALPAVERMEYEVARAVAALTAPAADDRPGVGWWQGHGEPDLAAAPADSPLRELARRLGERVNLRPLPGGEPIPDDVDLVVIAAPRRPVPAADQWALDQFVMRGGRVLAFLSSFQADFERGAPVEVDHGLYALFGQYGITVGRDLLIDRQHAERLSIPMGGRWVSLPHPLAPSTTLLDRAVPAVRGLPKLVLPFASTLRPVDPPPDGVEVEVWARSDADSASVKGLVTLDPTLVQNGRLSSEVPGPHPVVVAASGRFRSAFSTRPPPDGVGPTRTEGAPARVVVVGSADAVANDPELVLNAVDWLVEDPVLISLRSRIAADPPLPLPDRATRVRARIGIVGVPLGVLVGVALVGVRRERRSGRRTG